MPFDFVWIIELARSQYSKWSVILFFVCLCNRPNASSLLGHSFIMNYTRVCEGAQLANTSYPILANPFQSILRCSTLPLQPPASQGSGASQAVKTASLSENIRQRPLQEVYYLWSLAGGDLELEMKKVGLIPTKPPIFNVPRLVP